MSMPRSGEITRMRSTQESSMVDTCEIIQRNAGTDGYNLPNRTYPASGSPSACGFKPGSRREVQEEGQVIVADAELRLPVGTAISHLDHVKITHRHGTALGTPLTFEVIGNPARGPSGLVATLRTVDGG